MRPLAEFDPFAPERSAGVGLREIGGKILHLVVLPLHGGCDLGRGLAGGRLNWAVEREQQGGDDQRMHMSLGAHQLGGAPQAHVIRAVLLG